ncbi:MAG: dipeptidase [Candidatus Thorarchaeota archaeon]
MDDHVKEILSSNIIIDTLSHGPLPWSDDLVAACDEMLARDMNPWDVIPELVIKFAYKVVNEPKYFDNYVKSWKDCGVNCVSWTVGPMHSKPYSFEGVFHNYSFMTYMLDNRKDFFLKILKAEDFEKAKKEEKRGIILNFQSMQHIDTDINLVELYYMQGIRVMQLTYNSKNAVGTGCTARRDRGLTEFGLDVVNKMNELGIIVDVSHCGMQTSMDAAINSKDPIIASHTFSKNLYDHDRGKTDDLLKIVAEKGGYIGVLAVPGFLTANSKTTINDWLDHVDYIVNLIGIDHVGIGTDYYGFSVPDSLAIKIGEFMEVLGFRPEHRASFLDKVKGFERYAKFPNLIKGLIDRGYSDKEVIKLAGLNFLKVFKNVVG